MAPQPHRRDYLGGKQGFTVLSGTARVPLHDEISDGAYRHQDTGAEKHRPHADMAADIAAGEGADHLADILRRHGITEDAAGDRLRHVVADDTRDTRLKPAKRNTHQEAQYDELPAIGDEGLRDQ